MKRQIQNGIEFPAKMKYNSWIVVGPPGSGKSHMIETIRGWPGEVCIDITMKHWWSVEPLAHRPREVHFSLPFKGTDERYAVYDEKWIDLKSFPELDVSRIKIPKKKKFILAPNWRSRYVFDFILPPPEWLLRTRQRRNTLGDAREVDKGLTIDLVRWQVNAHWHLARYFYQSGLQVMLRPFNTVRPYSWRIMTKAMAKKPVQQNIKLTPDSDWSKLTVVQKWGGTGPDWQ